MRRKARRNGGRVWWALNLIDLYKILVCCFIAESRLMATGNDKPTGVELPNEFACKFWSKREVSEYVERSKGAKLKVDPRSFKKKSKNTKKHQGLTRRQIAKYEEWGSPTPTRTGPALVKDKKTGAVKLVQDVKNHQYLYMHPHEIVSEPRPFMSPEEGMKMVQKVLQRSTAVRK